MADEKRSIRKIFDADCGGGDVDGVERSSATSPMRLQRVR